jgi:hypothetical protein
VVAAARTKYGILDDIDDSIANENLANVWHNTKSYSRKVLEPFVDEKIIEYYDKFFSVSDRVKQHTSITTAIPVPNSAPRAQYKGANAKRVAFQERQTQQGVLACQKKVYVHSWCM